MNRHTYGENDFLVVHPEKGIMLIEVKGGEVKFQGRKFFTRPLHSAEEFSETANPFEQARKFSYTLLKYINQASATRASAQDFRVIDAVWFPDISWTQPAMMQYDSAQIFDDLDLAAPQAAIDRVYAILAVKFPVPVIDERALKGLINLLAPVSTPHQTLRDLFERNRRRLRQLTEEQVNGLLYTRFLKRIAFTGGAGTGKTVLGFEIAARLTDEGKRVMFLCFNREQADYLRGKNHEHPADHPANFDIRYIIFLAKLLLEQAHLDPSQIDRLRLFDAHDREQMAALMNQAIDRLVQDGTTPRWQYDAIIVDEAQDIARPFWAPIQRLLADPKESHLYIFYDPSQQFDFADNELKPILETFENTIPLERNVRNTRQIYTLMREYNPALSAILPAVASNKVEFLNIKKQVQPNATLEEAEIDAMITLLDALVLGGVDERDILIITCRPYEGQFGTRLGKRKTIGNHVLRPLRDGELPGCVRFSTIRSAKGQESDVVIIVELEGLREDRRRSRLIYTAISRARNQLYVMGTRGELKGKFVERIFPGQKKTPENA